MSTTINSNTSPSLLDAAIEEASAGFDVAAARVQRLLGTAFEDPARVQGAFLTLIRQKGTEETIRILTSDGTFGRLHHFGFTRGALFARGSRHLAKQALEELPEAIRDRQMVATKLHDLTQARCAALERLDCERLETNQPETPRQRARSRG